LLNVNQMIEDGAAPSVGRRRRLREEQRARSSDVAIKNDEGHWNGATHDHLIACLALAEGDTESGDHVRRHALHRRRPAPADTMHSGA
jgi:hypothetical protein